MDQLCGSVMINVGKIAIEWATDYVADSFICCKERQQNFPFV